MSRYTPLCGRGGRPGAARPAPGLGGADSGRVPVGLGAPEGAAPGADPGLAGKGGPEPGAEPPAGQPGDPGAGGGRALSGGGRPTAPAGGAGSRQELVRRALGELERPDRELFVRHYYYGQTVARAAEEMGLNPSTAKTRLRRGREKAEGTFAESGVLC